jgi:signal transduction histidine kinase
MYMLENYDMDWRPANNEHTASYYMVPPGKYVFRVKVANSDGVWAERTLPIVIHPPWWQTWWAYLIYLLLFLLSLRIFSKWRERKLRLEKVKLEEIVEERTKELKASQAQLIQSEKMASLGELTAGIAHEIQNPLNFVNNFSELNKELVLEASEELGKGDFEEAKAILKDIGENSEKINHHGKRADAIVKGMLEHSRANKSEKSLTNLNALAEEFLKLSYHGLRAKDKSFNADFKLNLDPTLPKVNVVASDIGRVILNLVNNAFYVVDEKAKSGNAGPEYKPTVTVSSIYSPLSGGQGGSIAISVQDNGDGIPDSIKEKIFQPFFTTKPTGQGTGLGLSLSYDIVKAHGGELKVETMEAEWAEFIIILSI